MLSRFNILFLIVFMIMASLSTYAGSKRKLVQENMEISGYATQLALLPDSLQESFNQSAEAQKRKNAAGATIRYSKKVSAIYVKAFKSYDFNELFLTYVSKHISEDVLSQVNQWYKDDFGKSIVAEEIEASEPSSVIKLREFAVELEFSPPGEYRSKLIRRLDKVTGNSRINAGLANLVLEKITFGLNAGMPKSMRKPASEILNSLELIRPAVEQQVYGNTLLALHFTYRNLTNKEILRYLKFLESRAGRVYHKSLSSLLDYGMKEAIKNTHREV